MSSNLKTRNACTLQRTPSTVVTQHSRPHPEPTYERISTLHGWTLLEFGASWCGVCARTQPEIQHALREFPLTQHLKVEDGPGRPLGRRFGIKLWPTLVLLCDGQEVARRVRPANREVIADLLQRSIGSP